MFIFKKISWIIIGFFLSGVPMISAVENQGYFIKTDSSDAVVSLLLEAKDFFEKKEYEQSAALLERALRISPRNAILWHNLAGVRLQQEQWSRAASLAAKSNSLAVKDTFLRVRNWVITALACEGLGDKNCAEESRRRARTLAAQE
jgi:tetratricopeptide (TPR) repeat protein